MLRPLGENSQQLVTLVDMGIKELKTDRNSYYEKTLRVTKFKLNIELNSINTEMETLTYGGMRNK